MAPPSSLEAFFLTFPPPPTALLMFLVEAVCELSPEVKCPSRVSMVADMLKPLVPFDVGWPAFVPCETIFPSKLTEF